MNAWIESLLRPIPEERFRVSRERYESLPEALQSEEQIIGLAHHSCGATHGVMERCDLACTSCYLGEEANASKPLDEAEVYRQLDDGALKLLLVAPERLVFGLIWAKSGSYSSSEFLSLWQ